MELNRDFSEFIASFLARDVRFLIAATSSPPVDFVIWLMSRIWGSTQTPERGTVP